MNGVDELQRVWKILRLVVRLQSFTAVYQGRITKLKSLLQNDVNVIFDKPYEIDCLYFFLSCILPDFS